MRPLQASEEVPHATELSDAASATEVLLETVKTSEEAHGGDQRGQQPVPTQWSADPCPPSRGARKLAERPTWPEGG